MSGVDSRSEALSRASSRSSARRAERGIALVAPTMRAVVLVQILLAAASGAGVAEHRGAYWALTLSVVAVSLLLIVQCLVTGSVLRGAWHVPDLLLAWLAVPAMNLLLPDPFVVGTWEAWASGFAVNVGALAAAWLPPGVAMVHGVALGGWYLAWTLTANTTSWETSLSNALTIPGYALVVALLTHYLRGLAVDADQSREDAVAATRALELERYQLTVHDASSILRLLSDEDTPAEVLPGLRLQADREAQRLRTYLGAEPPRVDSAARTVGTMLATALEGFEDLPIEPAVALGAHVELGDAVWTAVGRAVTTVLHNVRLHAQAHQVVVHADTDDTTWEVVVSDDGVGFDQENQPLGFGLDTQVGQALRDVGVTVDIRSAPGHGTSVTITGPVAEVGA
ncbi:Signal transduction histidine kinase [Aeromicrobium choanae]|uniref:Signal transduction histidine kinase n=1 Tax=Aeromicrobium choanae TaxID=1736691 RepID=A0A1T4YZM8_9ACTN|nr:Signal transduction histidine kinase [Aeromicrobium choanae]